MATTEQRERGVFYTPTPFAKHAHKEMAKVFGEDWKEKYIVWDNSCGLKALTKDFTFASLYSSTLEVADIELSRTYGYNEEAISFQFDFLNDDLNKLPKSLFNALVNRKPIIFFINPPYATAGNYAKDGTSKGGCAKTKINELMLKDKIGASSQNLFAQFLYRIIQIKKLFNLTDIHIGMFTSPLFLIGSTWKGFRKLFLNEFKFESGFYFTASAFEGCADSWGVSFTTWKCGTTDNKDEFVLDMVEQRDNNEIVSIGKKTIYNLDNLVSASEWVKPKLTKGEEKVNSLGFKSAFKIAKTKLMPQGYIGDFLNDCNRVMNTARGCGIFASGAVLGHNSVIPITPQNFEKCVTLFAVRKVAAKYGNWSNGMDEFIAPNMEHPKWNEFVGDCLIFSLFNSDSNQVSLRGIQYEGQTWDIQNQFFWLPSRTMWLNNPNLSNFPSEYTETFVTKYLDTIDLSNEAENVYIYASGLTLTTLDRRYDDKFKDKQISNWDAGFAQIKLILTKEELNELRNYYDTLGKKIYSNVYDLGFLK